MFGKLQLGWLADFDALQSRQNPTIRLHRTHGLGSNLADVERFFQQSLGNPVPLKSGFLQALGIDFRLEAAFILEGFV
jgi:hypothetical protein